MKKFVKWWLPVAVWMGVIFVGSSIARVPRVGDETLDGLVHRAAHLLEFAVLGALLLRALSKDKPVSKREIIITLMFIALYGASDEFHQRFTPGRSSEGISVLFDVAGGMVGAWAWRRVSTNRQRINGWVSTDGQRINEWAANQRMGDQRIGSESTDGDSV